MKRKLLFLALGLMGFAAAKATDSDPGAGCGSKGKKDDLAGMVFHADNKRPLKDVNVTAYCSSKKEKTVMTDDVGNYAFGELKPGTYKFVFEKAGFKKVTKEKVIVRTDEGFQLNIEMIEAKDVDPIPSPLHFADF